MDLGRPDWEEYIGGHPLSEDEVHVWRIGLEMAAVDFAKLQRVLSKDESEKADRFHFESDRRRAVIGRGHLRLLLGEALDSPADGLRFDCDDFGKPRLPPSAGPSLQFNVSHSGELILIAITIGRSVGVDVEKIRTDFDFDEVASRFFSTHERRVLAALDGHAKSEAFFKFWTLKEAYLKARGVGLSAPLDQCDVSTLFDKGPRPSMELGEAGEWTLRPLSVAADYAAALAAKGPDWKLKCWSLSPRLLSGLIH